MSIKISLTSELYSIISLYRDIYNKKTVNSSITELICYGLKYKDLQRKKENLKPLSELLEEWKIKDKQQKDEEKKQMLEKERKDLISRVIGINK